MANVTIKLDGQEYSVRAGATILEAAQETQRLLQEFRRVEIPTLYYLKGIVDVDESGVCVVEVGGQLVNASVTRVKDGMEISNTSPAVMAARKEALAAILARHRKDCLRCTRSKSCELQELLHTYGFTDEPDLKEGLEKPDDSSAVLVRDNNKCIRCKRCINVCAKVQAVSAIACTGGGLDAVIAPSSPKGLAAASCVNCGQCVAVCPVGALTEKDHTEAVRNALEDPSKFVVAQVAPAVRAALGESFEFPLGVDVEGKLPCALRKLGFDKVFDTKFGADLTVAEEVHELLERLGSDGVLPMITSCCPGWIKYCEHFYPDMLDHLSTCRSPQQMLGAAVKRCYAETLGVSPENIVVVSVMPCTAKKFELTRPELAGDVDISITTRELARMLKTAEIQLEALPGEPFDQPLGTGTGAGVIFGASGGVMEAALRTAARTLGGSGAAPMDFTEVRGMSGVKEAAYELGGRTVRVAAVSGLANANALLTRVKNGEADYQFIEIMACPGGCVNGGGQPYQPANLRAITDVSALRAAALYRNGDADSRRDALEDPAVTELYRCRLGQPGSEAARKLLHTHYTMR